jgi:hypothetical protein
LPRPPAPKKLFSIEGVFADANLDGFRAALAFGLQVVLLTKGGPLGPLSLSNAT